jgi:hypothetical protein
MGWFRTAEAQFVLPSAPILSSSVAAARLRVQRGIKVFGKIYFPRPPRHDRMNFFAEPTAALCIVRTTGRPFPLPVLGR